MTNEKRPVTHDHDGIPFGIRWIHVIRYLSFAKMSYTEIG